VRRWQNLFVVSPSDVDLRGRAGGALDASSIEMASTDETERSSKGTSKIAVAALALIGGVFVAEAVLSHVAARGAIAEAERIERDSVVSVEQLSRIAHDLDEERILVDDHIFESTPAKTRPIEDEIDSVNRDLELAEDEYAPLIELPNEAPAWNEARGIMLRFQRDIGATLELSRENRDKDARVMMLRTREQYATLDHTLSKLISLNRKGAVDSVERVREIGDAAERTALFGRLIGIGLVVAVAIWLVRRVASYEKRLAANARELKEKNRELDDFAGRVAHDLKSALAPLAMAPSLMRRDAVDPGRIADLANRNERAAKRAASIVDSLLTFARNTRTASENEECEVEPVVRAVVEEMAPLAARIDATLLVEEVAHARIRCDTGLLHVVLANLIGNAVKYLESCPQRFVVVSAYIDGAYCRIDVADTGRGIAREEQARIFTPFYRVAGSAVEGSGLGLATVRRIVDARGGRVTVDSDLGNGSRFHVWLPLALTVHAAVIEQPTRR
jgi:signal transduction histidine kinase